jgi:hypothetical protein
VLAARLSEDSSRKIVLLEAGHAYDPDRFPAALLDASTIADPDHDWGYTSRGNNRNPQLPTPRGKVLGGSSAVNATVACGPEPATSPNGAPTAPRGGPTKKSFLLSAISKTRPPETTSTTDAAAHCLSGKEQTRS